MASYNVPHMIPAPHRTMMKAMTEAYGIRPRQSTDPVRRKSKHKVEEARESGVNRKIMEPL